jgi:hypothetical protein
MLNAPAGLSSDSDRWTRTWDGAPARVRTASCSLCEAALWGVVLPRRVNMLIRRSLPVDGRLRLSYWHELGHLQVLPRVAAAALMTWGSARRVRRSLMLSIPGLNALWELLAESYVVWKVRGESLRIYRRAWNPFLIPFLDWHGRALCVHVCPDCWTR